MRRAFGQCVKLMYPWLVAAAANTNATARQVVRRDWSTSVPLYVLPAQ